MDRLRQKQAAEEKKKRRELELQERERRRQRRLLREGGDDGAAATPAEDGAGSAADNDDDSPDDAKKKVPQSAGTRYQTPRQRQMAAAQAQAQAEQARVEAQRATALARPQELLDLEHDLPMKPNLTTRLAVHFVRACRRSTGLLFRSLLAALRFVFSKHFLYVLGVVIAIAFVMPPISTSKQIAFDPYEYLNLPRNTTTKEVERQFRKLSVQMHPDRNRDDPDAEKKFIALNRAKEILVDPTKRQNFDEFGDPDGPRFLGVTFPAFLMRKERGVMFIYIVLILSALATPLIYKWCGGVSPSFDTKPFWLMTRQIQKHMLQLQTAAAKEDHLQLFAHSSAAYQLYQFILGKMSEWQPTFLFPMLVIASEAAFAACKVCKPQEAQRMLEDANSRLTGMKEYAQLRAHLGQFLDGQSKRIRAAMEDIRDQKDNVAPCTAIDAVLKKWATKNHS